ncbi:MAG: hypothetical protein L0Y54_04870 [Sporichthyaceae bacterium]|nr:hypothetical protein [Sporichthyaceae bacterium]
MSDTDDWDWDFPVLPEQTADDTDAAWGEAGESTEDDIERLLGERPPHHDR